MQERIINIMQSFVSGLKGEEPKKIGILFSGGRDSSILAAALACVSGVEIHLLTMTNGVSHGLDRIEAQAAKIKRVSEENGVVLYRKVIDVTDQFQKLVMREIEKDFIKRKFASLLTCVGCKYIMHVAALDYAKQMDLDAMVDGYSVRQEEFPEQTHTFMKRVENLYAFEGVVACSPLYEVLDTRENIIAILHAFGLEKSEGNCMFAFAFSPALPQDIILYLDALERRLEEDPFISV